MQEREFERHSEATDNAQQLAAELNERAWQQFQQNNKPEQVKNPDGTWPITECVDCDIEIPQGRLELGYIRCVDCKTKLTQRQARGL